MLTLYGVPHSRAHRVMWALRELNVPFHQEPINFADATSKTPTYLAINPNGRVPAINDDGLILFESMAINLYLAKKHGGPLAPRNLMEEAQATQWSFWAVTELEKLTLTAVANRMLYAPEDCRESEVTAALADLARPLTVLNQHLANTPHLLGPRFTIADLNVASILALSLPAHLDLTPHPHVQTWLEQCLARPAASDYLKVAFTMRRK